MMKQSHPFWRILLTPFLPLGVAGTSYLIEKLLSSLHFLLEIWIADKSSGNTPGYLNDFSTKDQSNSVLAGIALVFQQFRMLAITVYDHYFAFFILMMIIHIGTLHFNKKKNEQRGYEIRKSTAQLRNILGSIIYYTISFFILKFLVLILSTYCVSIVSNWSETQPQLPSMFQPTDLNLFKRGLSLEEDEENDTGRMLVAQKPVYLKTIHESYANKLHPLCVVYSDDFQTAFVVQREEVTIYNVSEPTNPIRLGFLGQNFLQYGSAVLSSKTPTLFLMRDNLQILNVTDLKNPTVMSRTEGGFSFALYHQSSLAINSNEKYAICTGSKIKIFDISDLSAPELVFFEVFQVTTVLLSGDDKTAYIGSYESLQIWDVSYFEFPRKVLSFPVRGVVLGSIFSKDKKTLFLACSGFDQNAKNALTLSIINIRDSRNPILQREVVVNQALDLSSFSGMRVTISPDDRFLIIRTFTDLWMINLGDYQVTEIKDATLKVSNIGFLPNTNNALIFSVGTIRLSELYLNIPSEKSSSPQPNYLSQISLGLPSGWAAKQIVFAPLNKRAFITAENEKQKWTKMLLDIDLHDYSKPLIRQTFNSFLAAPKILFTLSSDENDLYYVDEQNSVHFINTQGGFEDKNTIKYLKFLRKMVAVTSNKKTMYTVCHWLDCEPELLYVFDISNPASPKQLKTIPLQKINQTITESEFENNYLKFSSDEQTLFYLHQKLQIIDVSDHANPVWTAAFDFDAQITQTFAFTSDYRTCFVISTMLELDGGFLKAIDLTDYHTPVVIYSLGMPVDSNYQLSVSKDDRFLFMSTSEDFITLDISNKTSITVSDVQSLPVTSFALTENDENVVVCYKNSLQVFQRKSRYAIDLPQNRFKIGNSYSNPIKILELNNYNNYGSIRQNYKLIQASLHSAELKLYNKLILLENVLPGWISLDKESAALKLDLTNPVNLATHKLYLSASTEVLADSFLQIGDANYNKSDAQNLQAYLFGQGYLDYERFLTPIFDDNTPLLLNTQYLVYEQEIRQILKSHRIEVITPISIESSLELEKTKPLQIRTPSMRSIRLTIELFSGSKFVTQTFSAVKSSLTEEKTSLFLEGVLININEALNALLINEGDEGSCDGTMTISDGLNPIVTHRFDKMSDFVKTNKQPKMNEDHSIQSQVDKVFITAGEHFIIEFSEKSFADLNRRPLTFALEMPDKSTEVPDWITMQGRTLMGTPPEQFLPYKKEFCIKISNEYKSTPIVFTLSVNLSFVTILKRVLILVGYLVTAYKFWQHSDKFYNILFKKSYRYQKVLKISCNKEISEKTIFPILFIRDEVQGLGKNILNMAKLHLGRITDRQLIESMVDSETGRFNKERLSETIENSVVENSKIKKSNEIVLKYQREDIFGKELVHQIIANELTMKRLKFSDEKKTFDCFERIKDRWMDFVSMNQGSAVFFIKDQSLYEELQNQDIIRTAENSIIENHPDESQISPTKRSIEKELILNPGDSTINIGLLKDAILAYAFNCQNIKANRNNVDIRSKEITNSESMIKFLKGFLRFDMNDLVQHSTKRLGYGLKYKLHGDKIRFYGKLEEHLNNKTLVVQIIKKGGYLLREIFIQKPSSGDYEMISNNQTIEDVQEEL